MQCYLKREPLKVWRRQRLVLTGEELEHPQLEVVHRAQTFDEPAVRAARHAEARRVHARQRRVQRAVHQRVDQRVVVLELERAEPRGR